MPPLIGHAFGRIFTAPPMPAEAFPPGLLGKTPAAHAVMEQAWRTMFETTLLQGIILGALLSVLVIVGIVVRMNLKTMITGAITNAIK